MGGGLTLARRDEQPDEEQGNTRRHYQRLACYHRDVGRRLASSVVVGVVAALAAPAFAEIKALKAEQAIRAEQANLDVIALADRWHEVPKSKLLKLSVQIVDEVTELGNLIGTGMNELSDDVLGLKFDGRKRRAKLRLGTGEGQYLRFRLESDWHFTQGKARIAAKLQLGIGEHQWNIELPDMEMLPASYRGERGVEVRIPLFERKW